MRILFLDMDECLVSTRTLEYSIDLFRYPASNPVSVHSKGAYFKEKINSKKELIRFAKNSDVKLIDYDGQIWATKLRPLTFNFLKKVREIFDRVYVLTAGAYDFQEAVLVSHDIISKIDGIFSSKDSWDDIPKSKDSILIDDLEMNTQMLLKKLTILGKISIKDYEDLMDRNLSKKEISRVVKKASRDRVQITKYEGSDIDAGFRIALNQINRKVNLK